MTKRKTILIKFLLGNGIQTLQLAVSALIIFQAPSVAAGSALIFCWVYLTPPLVARLILLAFGRIEGRFETKDREFWIWYFVSQLQVMYLRFPFLEEILRAVPWAYSNWLRLWGAKIGKHTYWSPKVTIMDRSHLRIGDSVIVGYGAGFTSHHLNKTESDIELVLKAPVVGNNVVLGGLSGMTPGSVVCDGETLPSTMGLAPFYTWKNGRRFSQAAMTAPEA